MIDFEDKSDDTPDDVVPSEAEEQYVVMIGDISSGWRTVGPFSTFDEAQSWAEEAIGNQENTWVMPICHPNSRDARLP